MTFGEWILNRWQCNCELLFLILFNFHMFHLNTLLIALGLKMYSVLRYAISEKKSWRIQFATYTFSMSSAMSIAAA